MRVERNLAAALGIMMMVLSLNGCYIMKQQAEQKNGFRVQPYQNYVFKTQDADMVMKVCINVLQDEGYYVRNISSQAGILIVERVGINDSFYDSWVGVPITTYEVIVNVMPTDKEVRVTVTFIEKKYNVYGGKFTANWVQDARVYQDFFANVERWMAMQKGK